MENPLAGDLNHILEHTNHLWESLRGQRIFITGGTGFFGCWLLESLVWADLHYHLGVEVVILSRDPIAFKQKAPHIASYPAINLFAGNILNFDFPSGQFKYIIHAAGEHRSRLVAEQQLSIFETIVEGTRHTLQFAQHCGAQAFLLTSSGAIYGRQPLDLPYLPEGFLGAPDTMDLLSAYGEGKRAAETLCTLVSQNAGFDVKIARCFAFIGPYLPLNENFAVGNFIRDGLKGGPIQVLGDGTPYRSYLYAADMVIWLWTILLHGKSCYPYNVGSDHAISIAQLAELVADQFEPKPKIMMSKAKVDGNQPDRYIPSIDRATSDLQLHQTVNLRQALNKTISFASGKRSKTNDYIYM